MNSGKVINYLGQQHFTGMSGLTRTSQELNTFKRAVNDSKETIQAMEKERTEYRASLALMKNCSADIDPDSGRGLEKFRTSQKYVKYAKQKFDKFSLACLQKVTNLNCHLLNNYSCIFPILFTQYLHRSICCLLLAAICFRIHWQLIRITGCHCC